MSKFKKIISITTSITTIAMVSGIAMLAPLAAGAVVTGVAEGDMIKTADNPDIYIAKYVGSKQFKRLILSPSVFNSYGHLKWENVKTVSQATLDQFTVSTLVRAEGDPKVYNLYPTPNSDIGGKHWVNMTAEQFTSCNTTNTLFDWDSVYQINTADRDSYTVSTDDTTCTLSTEGGGGTVSALSVALASDTPVASMAPANAARVGFTKVNFTASSAGSVTINSLTVQRTGLAVDAAIGSVMLIDTADDSQLGLNQVLNANHQAIFPDAIVIPAGTTKSILIAANMPASTAAYAGQVVTLSLVAVTTASSISGTLPITGNYNTINASLAIGTASITVGALDPGTAFTKEVGVTNYNFSSLKVTAGSVEDVSVNSIRWNQSGSAASSDLANVKVNDGTTDYAATISSDGKYYSVNFATPIVIAKGLSKEFTIKGDIANGSARTISFDIYRNTDIVIKGTTYGYSLIPAFTSNGVTHATAYATAISATTSPYFAGAHVTIGTGSLRVDKNSSAAPAANVTEGATGVILGAFDFVVLGEEVRPTSIILSIDIAQIGGGASGSSSDITNIVLAKADGTVIAGPVNGVDGLITEGGDGTATFSGSVSFPVGTTAVIVKGNINIDFQTNDTIAVGLNTPFTKVTGATGATTGNAVEATPASAVWANTMTVKAGALAVKVSGSPAAQSVVRGITGFTFANLIFDATASGEDIRITSVAVQDGAYTASTQAFIQSLQLWDGTTALNIGSNVVNPTNSATASTTLTFSLNNPLVVTKGTIKSIALKGNISGSATASSHEFGLAAAAAISATGVSTGQDIGEAVTAANGQKMDIVVSGQWSVQLDSASPSAKLSANDITGVELTKLRFRATGEQINITNLRLQLTSASSTGVDLVAVSLWDGTQVASGVFIGAGGAATADFVLSPSFVIPKNDEKVLIIKGDIAKIGTGFPGTSGHTIAVDFDGTTAAQDYGVGYDSGANVFTYSADTAANKVTMHKSVPTVSKLALGTNTLANGSAVPIYKFKVTADTKGDIDLYRVTFRFATTTATLTNLVLYDVTETDEVAVQNDVTLPTYSADNHLTLELNDVAATPRTISAGSSRTFELRGAVSGVTTGSSLTAQLEGDAAVIATVNGTYLLIATDVANDVNNDFIWSDRSADLHTVGTADWTNGYLVSGLPSSNLTPEVLSK